MLKLYPNIEFCHCVVWGRISMLKVEEIEHVWVFILSSFFFWLPWLVVPCSLLFFPHQDLVHLGFISWIALERYLEEIFPFLVWVSFLGTSRALSLIKATFSHVYALSPRLRLDLYSRANYIFWMVDHLTPDERNAHSAVLEKRSCHLLI